MIAGGVTLSVIVSPVVAAVTVGQSVLHPLHPPPSLGVSFLHARESVLTFIYLTLLASGISFV